MTAIPVPSDMKAAVPNQRTSYDDIKRNSSRLDKVERANVNNAAAMLTQTVTNGDTEHAPSGDAVFDFVNDEVDAVILYVDSEIADALSTKFLSGTASLNFPSVGAFLASDLTIAVPGAAVGDSVALAPPAAINAGFLWCGWVSAANVVTVRVYNLTGVAINPAAQTWGVTVIKP